MALNVISNYAANVAHRYLQQSDEAATRSVAKLSAGTRVLCARDDAASLAIATSIRSDIGGLKQASVNAGQASSMLQIADGAMGTVTDVLVRLKTLAVQASSDQLTNDQRSQIGVEFGALQKEIDRIAQSTRFDGQTLLNGNGVGGGSSILAGSVSKGNAANNGAAYSFQVDQDAAGSDLGAVTDTNIVITAKVGGSEIKLSGAKATLDTVAEIATAINADKLFSQYFVASSEKVNDSDTTARLYLTALSEDPLVSFKIEGDTAGTTSAITGLAATDIKVGQSVAFDLDGRNITSKDKISFNLGGIAADLNISDLRPTSRRWPLASRTATSPVRRNPSAVNVFAVASGLFR